MPTKVLVIGFDSGDRDIVLAGARDGSLPNFGALLTKSLWGETGNPKGVTAGSVWPSFYTGASPAEHGLYDPLHRFNPETYREDVWTPEEFPLDPIWSILGRAGRRVAVFDAPYAFADDEINGVQLLDWGTHAPMTHFDVTHHPDRFRTRPPHLAADIAARFEPDPIGTCDSLYLRSRSDYRSFRDSLVERAGRKADLALHLLHSDEWDLFLTVFSECHCVGHQCWHFHDPGHPDRDPAMVRALGDPVADVYAALDTAVGRIVSQVGPDTTILLFFSHGTEPCYTGTFLLDQILERLEGHNAPGFRHSSHALRTLWRNLPAPFRRSLAPFKALVLPGIKARERGLHRSERKYFEILTNDAAGGIRINVVGREAKGRVEPGADYDAVCDELAADLLEMENRTSGGPAVKTVLKTGELYSGPHAHMLPDLLVEWNRDVPIRRIWSPKLGRMDNRLYPNRSGDHSPVGLFLLCGPSIGPRRLDRRLPVYDLAPTIGRLLDVDMQAPTGKAIAAVGGPALRTRGAAAKRNAMQGSQRQ